MPKLDKKLAKTVDATESQTYEPLPEGSYDARLLGVTTREGHKAPYWSWEFAVVGGEHDNRRLFVNTSLSPKAAWKLKEVFDAFGYSTDSDTDEMCGEVVKLLVKQQIIPSGSRAGEIGNSVERVLASDNADNDDETEVEDWD